MCLSYTFYFLINNVAHSDDLLCVLSLIQFCVISEVMDFLLLCVLRSQEAFSKLLERTAENYIIAER